MPWDLSFDIRGVDGGAFADWLRRGYGYLEGRSYSSPGGDCGIEADYMGADFSLEEFLGSVEDSFPGSSYTARYRDVVKMTDAVLQDVTVEYAGGRRAVTDNLEESADAFGRLLEENGAADLFSAGEGMVRGVIGLCNSDTFEVPAWAGAEDAKRYALEVAGECAILNGEELPPEFPSLLAAAGPREAFAVLYLVLADDWFGLSEALPHQQGNLRELDAVAGKYGLDRIRGEIQRYMGEG